MKSRSRVAATALLSALLILAALGLWGCGTSGTKSAATDTSATQSSATHSPTTHTAATLVSTESRAEPSAEAQAQIPILVTGNTAFALDLFKASRSTGETAGKNLVLSPYSLSLALAMTHAGARGETESQMAEALHFALPQQQLHAAFNALDVAVMTSDAEKLTSAASAWVFPLVLDDSADIQVRQEYLDLLARDYGAALYQAPSDTEEARQIINEWTEQKTEGLIPEILPPLSLPQSQTTLVLANAMYLKNAWKYAFPAENTRPAPFYLDDGAMMEVPMMSHFMNYAYADDAVWAAVDLPCLGKGGRLSRGDISAVFLLPKEGSLDQAVAATTAESLQTLLSHLPPGAAEDCIDVHLPRFKFDTSIELEDPLISLGMVDAFDSDRADFSGAYSQAGASEEGGPVGIWVDEVYHGGAIAVDEVGIEAAAGTMVVQVAGIGPGEIVFDRPFLFVLRHVPTGAILFMGQVTNPLDTAGNR